MNINKKDLKEQEIRTMFITPALNNKGWKVSDNMREEYYFTDGRVLVAGNQHSVADGKKADYLLYHNGKPIAVLEAKDNKHAVGGGIQQAIDYAQILDLKFAYSSNGDAFLEHDFTTGKETELKMDEFPTEDELYQRYLASKNYSETEQKMLKKLGSQKYTICFIDGTHENFSLLKKYRLGTYKGGIARRISGNLYHLQRGNIFNFEGKSIFVMGGGESPDIDIRPDDTTWTNDELPNREEMREGAKNLEKYKFKVDYIITHEPAQKIKNFLKLKDGDALRFSGLNAYFQELSENCEYTRWFFGSLHEDKFVSPSQIALFQNLVNVQTGEIL